jgi:hypothetical protein
VMAQKHLKSCHFVPLFCRFRAPIPRLVGDPVRAFGLAFATRGENRTETGIILG